MRSRFCAAVLFEPHAKTMLETGMADLGGLDNALWMHLSISEVHLTAEYDCVCHILLA